eukprot:scaffold39321_cov61-Cyclotella_meneghiniana.AAC.3
MADREIPTKIIHARSSGWRVESGELVKSSEMIADDRFATFDAFEVGRGRKSHIIIQGCVGFDAFVLIDCMSFILCCTITP